MAIDGSHGGQQPAAPAALTRRTPGAGNAIAPCPAPALPRSAPHAVGTWQRVPGRHPPHAPAQCLAASHSLRLNQVDLAMGRYASQSLGGSMVLCFSSSAWNEASS